MIRWVAARTSPALGCLALAPPALSVAAGTETSERRQRRRIRPAWWALKRRVSQARQRVSWRQTLLQPDQCRCAFCVGQTPRVWGIFLLPGWTDSQCHSDSVPVHAGLGKQGGGQWRRSAKPDPSITLAFECRTRLPQTGDDGESDGAHSSPSISPSVDEGDDWPSSLENSCSRSADQQ